MTRIVDLIDLKGSSRTKLPGGYMRVKARLARTGIQVYSAHELGLTDRPAADAIRVYRPPEEVFDAASVASFTHKPVTDDHPSISVTADNARRLAVGWSGDTLAQEDEIYLAGDLLLTDAAVIAKVEAGKAELSNGYDCELEWVTGRTPQGEVHDAIQRKIVGNHIAIVDAGRCGEHCRIADVAPAPCGCPTCSSKEPAGMADHATSPATKTVLVDGLQVITTDAGAVAIERLQGQLRDATGKVSTAEATLATERSAWTDAKGKLEAELATAKASIPSGAALDTLVAGRTKLIGDAKRLAPALDATGKTDAEIRQLAVTAKLGDAAVAGKDAAFFEHGFALLVAQLGDAGTGGGGGGGGAGGDPIRQITISQPALVGDAAQQEKDKAWQEGNASLSDAWRGEQKTA